MHLIAATLCAAAALGAAARAEPPKALMSSVELIADHLDSGVIHGWHSNRLIRFGGQLYSSGVVHDENARNTWKRTGAFYRREKDGHWTTLAAFPQSVYTMMVDPSGIFWEAAPSDYANSLTFRMERPLDFKSFDRVYTGTCAYMGMGISPEGNVLILNAETGDMQAFVPNAITSEFYDHATGKWSRSRMVTPEGRYGYMGMILQGKRALAVLNSAIQDRKANPVAPHYSWRHVRLARCDDLTRGEWVQVPWLMPEYGGTALQDLALGPDGNAYLAYSNVSGSSYEETQKKPTLHYVARIKWDLTIEAFPTGLDHVGATRMLLDHAGGWHLVGRAGNLLHLWDLDAANGFKPTHEYVLPGTEKLQGYVIHTLRPERFGGQSDGDTVHLVTASYEPDPADPTKQTAALWHCSFHLPVARQ